MSNEWIVVLEVAAEPADSVGTAGIQRVVRALGDVGAVALVASDRYALQLRVTAETCSDAMLDAVSRWSDAARDAGMPRSDVVRAEVLTVSEFERERQVPA
jgi:hypothetical protein